MLVAVTPGTLLELPEPLEPPELLDPLELELDEPQPATTSVSPHASTAATACPARLGLCAIPLLLCLVCTTVRFYRAGAYPFAHMRCQRVKPALDPARPGEHH